MNWRKCSCCCGEGLFGKTAAVACRIVQPALPSSSGCGASPGGARSLWNDLDPYDAAEDDVDEGTWLLASGVDDALKFSEMEGCGDDEAAFGVPALLDACAPMFPSVF